MAGHYLSLCQSPGPDIKRKLQSLERLGKRVIRDLVAVAEKVYNKRETENQKEERREREHQEREKKIDKRQEKNLTKILDRQQVQMEKVFLTAEVGRQKRGQQFWPTLGKNQCRYCKEGHWARECPKITNRREASTGLEKKSTPILDALEENSD